MSIAAALAELERSPALPDHIAYLQRLVEDEQRRRERFVNDLDPDTQAEFINGRIVLHPPAQSNESEAAHLAANLLTGFAAKRNSGAVYRKECLVRCQRNDYMPDVCFFSKAKREGLADNPKIFPPPDLIVEVLSSFSDGNDRTLKLRDYARHEVGEYWVVDPDNRLVEQYVLPRDGGDYRLKARLATGGRLTSVMVDGLDAQVAALFDAQENQRVLQLLNEAS